MVQNFISGTIDLVDENVHYMLNVTNLGNSTYEYVGSVGFGMFCKGIKCPYKKVKLDKNSYSSEHQCQEFFHATDATHFKCVYDTSLNRVTIQSYYRFATDDIPNQDNTFNNIILEDMSVRNELDSQSYPYIRFLRTKSGISISRLCKTLFPQNPTIFLPSNAFH